MRAEAVEADPLIQARASATTSPGRALAESRPSHRVRNALVGVGAALGLAAGGFFGLRAVTAPDRSPTPSPSSSPVPTGVSSEKPTLVVPSPSPATSPSIAPETPEATPVPENTLKQQMQDYLDGNTPLPDVYHRFYMYGTDHTPAPLNVLDTENISFKQGNTDASLQGITIGQNIEYDTDRNPYLIELIGLRDGTKEDPASPEKGRFVIKANLGRLNSNDLDALVTQSGNIVSAPSGSRRSEILTVSQIQKELAQYSGNTMIFNLDVITGANAQGPDLPTDSRSRTEIRAQNEIAKQLILFCEQTLTRPYTEVPMSDLLNKLIITSSTIDQFDGGTFSTSAVPTTTSIRPYANI